MESFVAWAICISDQVHVKADQVAELVFRIIFLSFYLFSRSVRIKKLNSKVPEVVYVKSAF